jgi:hypothetical protein
MFRVSNKFVDGKNELKSASNFFATFDICTSKKPINCSIITNELKIMHDKHLHIYTMSTAHIDNKQCCMKRIKLNNNSLHA